MPLASVASQPAPENEEFLLDLEDGDGRPYKGRILGRQLSDSVYLTDDDRVIFYDRGRRQATELEQDEVALREALDPDEYVEVCHELDLEPIVDL